MAGILAASVIRTVHVQEVSRSYSQSYKIYSCQMGSRTLRARSASARAMTHVVAMTTDQIVNDA